MELTLDGKTYSYDEVLNFIKPVLEQYVGHMITSALNVHNANNHQFPISSLQTEIAILKSQIAGAEARNVLSEEVQKTFKEKLDELEATLADELGRAQDLAKEAKEKVEKLEKKQKEDKEDKEEDISIGDTWGTWDYRSPYSTPDQSLDDLLKRLNSPSLPTPTFKSINQKQFNQLSSTVPDPLALATKIEGLMIATGKSKGAVNNINLTYDPIDDSYNVKVEGDIRNIDFRRDLSTNKEWVWDSIEEHPQPTQVITSKKKGKKQC